MSFQQPAYLWLALSLVVALILYLLPMPRRRVATSALYLWERFLQAEHFGRTSERFRRAMGLALLAAILGALVLAAADLSVGRSPVNAGRVIVLIDTSASMNATHEGQSNLERAKSAAAELIASLSARQQVTIVEHAGELRVVRPAGPGGSEAARVVEGIEPFDGPVDLARALEEISRLWAEDEASAQDMAVYVFTDREIPDHSLGQRLRTWVAPPGGENVAITQLSPDRRGEEIAIRFAVANFGRSARSVQANVEVNGTVLERVRFDLQPGQEAWHTSSAGEEGTARIAVRLEAPADDVLTTDDSAYAVVPSVEALRVAVAWPESNRRNDYVQAVLQALKGEGVVGAINGESEAAGAPVTVYVNHAPESWPTGGAIVLYPLRGGAVQVEGLHPQSLSVTRQASHPLMDGVDLRGLEARNIVQVSVPSWAQPLAWAESASGAVPVIWAGQTEQSKVLFVGLPVLPSGSRLPLVASFPVLMRNAMQWMLPSAEVHRPGEMVYGATSRRVGFVQAGEEKVAAYSLLSAEESDLRRDDQANGENGLEMPGRRRSLAMALVVLAALLLPVEWWLFHRRITE